MGKRLLEGVAQAPESRCTNHPGRVNNRNHDNAIYIGSSDSEGAEENAGPAGLANVDVADEDVADEGIADEDVEGLGAGDGAGDGAGTAAADEVNDDDRGLLEMEVSLQTNRGRKREANQRLTEILAQLEDIDEEFAQQAEIYASRLPHAQAEVFRNARSVEGYLEVWKDI
ncbi:hypothetical protein [Absidia glauca]|uniref:Uncharacterized protein n=1 Tax=Absidia glauca TaxID=4829 RepID=A0A168MW16_ABSGL|nr:hypothetical protein [Absidia glauca]